MFKQKLDHVETGSTLAILHVDGSTQQATRAAKGRSH